MNHVGAGSHVRPHFNCMHPPVWSLTSDGLLFPCIVEGPSQQGPAQGSHFFSSNHYH